MSDGLLKLLPELLEHIFSYCHGSELLNFACCCKKSYILIKHLLWKIVKLPWKELDSMQCNSMISTMPWYQKNLLENLKFTVSLHIFTDDFNYLETKAFCDISLNYNEMISCCNPKKLIKLCIDGIVDDNGLKLICDTLHELQELTLICCFQVSDVGLMYLTALKYLNKLCLKNSSVEDSGLKQVAEISNLREVNLENCPCLTDEGLEYLSNLIKLNKLVITDTKYVISTGFDHLARLEYLTDIVFCHVSISDETFEYLSLSLCYLKSLKLTGCKDITDIGVYHISTITSLKYLIIISCSNITDTGVSYICNLMSLVKLDICGNSKITDIGFLQISNIPSLKMLNCSWTDITDVALSYISSLSSLKYLNVGGCCKVTDVGLLNLMPIKSLEVLIISHCNSITNNGLYHLNLLRSLIELDIRYCINISNEILPFLGSMNLRNLKY